MIGGDPHARHASRAAVLYQRLRHASGACLHALRQTAVRSACAPDAPRAATGHKQAYSRSASVGAVAQSDQDLCLLPALWLNLGRDGALSPDGAWSAETHGTGLA